MVVLPDLFIDVLAPLPAWANARSRLDEIAARGGGNLPIPPAELKLGGNAANLALAMARLGARVELIAETDPVGKHLLDQAAAGTRLRTGRVRVGDRASLTVGLECRDANIMLSDAGPLVDFGPGRLEREDWRLIEKADAVAVVNWAQNRRGTDLLVAVAELLENRPSFLFLDTADPRPRVIDIQRLLDTRSVWSRVDAWGMNENELATFSGDTSGGVLATARRLSARVGTRLDVHGRHYAASVTHDDNVRVPAERAPGRRLTGAGDAWNAGDLAGYLLGIPAKERLALAHRVATSYLTAEDGLPPTPEALMMTLQGTTT